MKKNVQVGLVITGIVALAGSFLINELGHGGGLSMLMASAKNSNTVWGHYSGVDATTDSFGCKEFWISCSTHDVVFEAPEDGSIMDRGTPSSNDIISWKALDDGRIIKKINSISGLEDTYSTTCGVLPDLSSVSASEGEVYFEIFDGTSTLVETSQIVNGETYTLKAKVDETENYSCAEASSSLVVNSHSSDTTVEYPANHIGLKNIKCSKCSEVIESIPMTQSELESFNLYAYDRYFEKDSGGYATTGEKIKDNYPEYSGGNETTGEGEYHVWNGGKEGSSQTIKMPKVDYTAFDKITFVLHVNTTWMTIGFGFDDYNDLMPYVSRSGRVSFALNCIYDENESVLRCSMNASNLENASFVISNTDIIEGKAGIPLKVSYGSWATVILDSILINHECSSMPSIPKSPTTLITDKICNVCNSVTIISGANYTYDKNDFSSNKYGLTISGDGLTVGTCSEDVGAIRLGGNQGAEREGEITLPRANYSVVKNVVFVFSCNTSNSYIGFNTTNRTQTLANSKINNKSYIVLHYENDTLYGVISTGNGSNIFAEIHDKNVITGAEGLKVFVKLPAWNFISVSKFIVNSSGISIYKQALNNELSVDGYVDTTWGAFSGGKWYSCADDDNHDLTLPKVNFNYCRELILVGAFRQGSKIGFDDDSLIYNTSAGDAWEYFIMKLTATEDGKLQGQTYIYAKCNDEGSDIHGDVLTRTSYLNFNELVTSSEVIIDNSNIYNGIESCHGLVSRRVYWNTTYEIAVADLILK